MSKINPAKKHGENFLAGGFGTIAARQEKIALLRRVVLANLLWEDNAYVNGLSTANHITELIPLCKAEDVYNLALEARLKQKLRHTPLFIAVQMCKYESMREYVVILLPQIITRADMLTDFLAIYWRVNGVKSPIAKCAQRGIAEAFHNFDEYQFAKYDRDAEIKLRDVMFLCHPKPRNSNEEKLFYKIANRELATPDTWEVALSSRNETKHNAWTRLITEKKIGALAFMRNIRNMVKAGVSTELITNGILQMNGAMLLPMDYLKAAVQNPSFKEAITTSMIRAYSNIPKLVGRTLFIVDCSGSMRVKVSSESDFNRLDLAASMAILAANQCEDFDLVLTAGDDSKREHSSKIINKRHKDFRMVETIKSTHDIGNGGIFTRQCLDWCRKNLTGKYDRIIIFSDSQDCDFPDRCKPSPFGKYNYIVDVSAHKHGINYDGVWTAEISGWSEHFMTYIAAYEGLENNFEE